MSTQQYEPEQPSGWAIGGIMFAASILTLIGFFQIISGFVAIVDDEFFVVTRNYTFDLDTTAWGWVHLLLGLLLLFTGFGLFARRTWAGVTALTLAMLSASRTSSSSPITRCGRSSSSRSTSGSSGR